MWMSKTNTNVNPVYSLSTVPFLMNFHVAELRRQMASARTL